VNALLMVVAGRVAGTRRPPNLFTTLGRHRGLFRRWLLFAGGLMPRGKLPRQDTELVILRVSHRSDCPYEADYHRRIGARAGLTVAQMDAAAADPLDPDAFSARHLAVLRAVDELHDDRCISDATFSALREHGLGDRDLVELCLLAGHYEMLAGTINSLGIERDEHRR
jgi:AhpD family alkylhydroperoxidase